MNTRKSQAAIIAMLLSADSLVVQHDQCTSNRWCMDVVQDNVPTFFVEITDNAVSLYDIATAAPIVTIEGKLPPHVFARIARQIRGNAIAVADARATERAAFVWTA